MPTIKDVAKQAGVSQSTVHYALSGKRRISAAVKARVFAVVDELGYSANALGQRMRQGRSYSIGLAAPKLSSSDAAIMEMLVSTATAASQAEQTLGIYMGQTPEQIVDLLKSQTVDGIILVETQHHDPRIDLLRTHDYPFVLLGRTEHLEGLSSVDFDFEAASFLAFEHLVKLGHKHIAFVCPKRTKDINLENWHYTQNGYKRAQAQYGFELLLEETELTIEEGYAATERLLIREPRLSAIVVAGHAHMGVLGGLYANNKRVPDDCSVVAITTAQVASWCTPTLTSVDIPLKNMSVMATQMLLAKIEGHQGDNNVLLPAHLVQRGSSSIFL